MDDKLKHFLVGSFTAASSVWFVGPLGAILLAALLGLLKEVYDYYFGGCVELNDILATIVGACASLGVLTCFL